MQKYGGRSKEPIVIDLRMLQSSGIGTYLRNLVPLVIAALPKEEFCLLGHRREVSTYSWAHNANTTFIDCQVPIYSIAEQIELPRKIPKHAALFWSPHYNIPLLYRGRLMATIHDVFHLAMPEHTDDLHKRAYAKGMFAMLRRKANAILCVSRFTRDELVRFTRQGRQNIYLTYLGIDDSWFHIEKQQRPHPRPFLLFVGNVKPHKNLKALLEAFELIKNQIPHDLLIVGQREGFITGDQSIGAKAVALGTRMQFTGYVKDKLLRQYFVHADALVLPSLYEGFGLPPLEAMACGCPAVVANAASLPEICGSAALYCDPYYPRDIADKISQVINDVSLREDLRRKGVEHAKHFTWNRCAEQTVDVIEQLLAVGA